MVYLLQMVIFHGYVSHNQMVYSTSATHPSIGPNEINQSVHRAPWEAGLDLRSGVEGLVKFHHIPPGQP